MTFKTLFRDYHRYAPKSILGRYWRRWRMYKALLFIKQKGWAK